MRPLITVLCVLFVLGIRIPAILARSDGFAVFWHEKEKYVPLRELSRAYDMSLSGPDDQRLILQNRTRKIVFKVDSREATVDGVTVWMHAPLERIRDRWSIREVDARTVIDPLIRPERHLRGIGHRIVVLDPGHGGHDTGAKGRRGVEEKRVVLDLARRIRAHLVNAGVRVYLTRENDRFVELDERTRKAARWRADLFVSIHLNSAANTSAAGIETYVLAAAGYESTAGGLSNLTQPGNRYEAANGIAAYLIQRSMLQRLRAPDRGVRRSRFLVLRNAPCPALLIECAFVSNPQEEALLLKESYRATLAESIARGILAYLHLVRRSQGEGP
ncbi:MAG: N-acetylmuramoyl-L-alanine amidase [Kiritimatiellae bacterium]|nr:N-acetylmuramoyl-L-alanine amidase [Kiritimatiellia bacterium]MDW8457559.1 N-acetylmuramoyl-L-alanine amidase [Verrucomicrobiota bacterium]